MSLSSKLNRIFSRHLGAANTSAAARSTDIARGIIIGHIRDAIALGGKVTTFQRRAELLREDRRPMDPPGTMVCISWSVSGGTPPNGSAASELSL